MGIEQLHKEVEDEEDADPELKLHVRLVLKEVGRLERIDGDEHYQQGRKDEHRHVHQRHEDAGPFGGLAGWCYGCSGGHS